MVAMPLEERKERRYRETHDSADRVDRSKAGRIRLPDLKPSSTSISIRLPISLLERIGIAANKRDMPYQSPTKTWLPEKLDAK